jgi:hypothetical protein
MFQVASFTGATYIAPGAIEQQRVAGMRRAPALVQPQEPSKRRMMKMKAKNDLSVWSIIERLQRRLERQGMAPAAADRAVSLALYQLALAPAP